MKKVSYFNNFHRNGISTTVRQAVRHRSHTFTRFNCCTFTLQSTVHTLTTIGAVCVKLQIQINPSFATDADPIAAPPEECS